MRRILVVDDDPHVRLAIRACLQQCGFRVAVGDGGANGIDALRTSTFDLMIVDGSCPTCRALNRSGRFNVATLAAVTSALFEPARQHDGGSNVEDRQSTCLGV